MVNRSTKSDQEETRGRSTMIACETRSEDSNEEKVLAKEAQNGWLRWRKMLADQWLGW